MTTKLTQPQPGATKRIPRRVWLAAIIVVLTAIIACSLWSLRKSKSVDERLAAIEAAREIPDSENAAVVYNKLMQDPNATSLLDNWPQFLNQASEELTFKEPWLSKDYPKLAAWVKEKQPVIDTLLEASRFEKCRFPIEMPLPENHLMRKWTYLLRRVSNNDIGDGRIDDAIDKWRCLVQMANHLRQQPLRDAYLVAIAIEAVAARQMAVFVVEGSADETHLHKIEMLPLQVQDNWAGVLKEIPPVQKLAEQKMKEQFSLLDRLKYELDFGLLGSTKYPDYDGMRVQHLKKLAISRGVYILVALRRYKNEHGCWPESLDEIKFSLSVEILTDPQNNSSFIYKVTKDGYALYSKGLNGVDEDGKYRDRCDDWPIWPPPGRETEAKEESAEPNESNPNTEPIE